MKQEEAGKAATGKLSAGLAARLGAAAAPSATLPADTKKREREASVKAEEGTRAKAPKTAADGAPGDVSKFYKI